jgi:hypothetical protein
MGTAVRAWQRSDTACMRHAHGRGVRPCAHGIGGEPRPEVGLNVHGHGAGLGDDDDLVLAEAAVALEVLAQLLRDRVADEHDGLAAQPRPVALGERQQRRGARRSARRSARSELLH